jgi:hypothetical protein
MYTQPPCDCCHVVGRRELPTLRRRVMRGFSSSAHTRSSERRRLKRKAGIHTSPPPVQFRGIARGWKNPYAPDGTQRLVALHRIRGVARAGVSPPIPVQYSRRDACATLRARGKQRNDLAHAKTMPEACVVKGKSSWPTKAIIVVGACSPLRMLGVDVEACEPLTIRTRMMEHCPLTHSGE